MKLSTHFELAEFASHDGVSIPDNLLPNVHDLVTGVLEPLRVRWNAPIVVISGYRTPAWNTRVGGAKASTHMTASGADVRPLNPSDLPAFFSCIEEMRVEGKLQALGGIGKYPGWAHLDINRASDGHLRRWHGAGIGSEQ